MDIKNSSILATENATNSNKISSQDKKNSIVKNAKKIKLSFIKKQINNLKNIFKKIINYPIIFLISIYIILHSGVSLSYLFGIKSSYSRSRFNEYSSLEYSDENSILGFSLSLFLFLVYKYFYFIPLKKILNYSLIFNLIFMILYSYFYFIQ